jgi:co-chaperonin GroES (HSP10)
MSDFDVEQTREEAAIKAKQLPIPKGYHLLCMVPKVEDQYAGGILKSDAMVRAEEHSTLVLYVVEIGDTAYLDKTRFPTGPWCKKGDFVLTRAYSGTRLKIHSTEFRIINDDSVEAVIEDPRGVSRV